MKHKRKLWKRKDSALLALLLAIMLLPMPVNAAETGNDSETWQSTYQADLDYKKTELSQYAFDNKLLMENLIATYEAKKESVIDEETYNQLISEFYSAGDGIDTARLEVSKAIYNYPNQTYEEQLLYWEMYEKMVEELLAITTAEEKTAFLAGAAARFDAYMTSAGEEQDAELERLKAKDAAEATALKNVEAIRQAANNSEVETLYNAFLSEVYTKDTKEEIESLYQTFVSNVDAIKGSGFCANVVANIQDPVEDLPEGITKVVITDRTYYYVVDGLDGAKFTCDPTVIWSGLVAFSYGNYAADWGEGSESADFEYAIGKQYYCCKGKSLQEIKDSYPSINEFFEITKEEKAAFDAAGRHTVENVVAFYKKEVATLDKITAELKNSTEVNTLKGDANVVAAQVPAKATLTLSDSTNYLGVDKNEGAFTIKGEKVSALTSVQETALKDNYSGYSAEMTLDITPQVNGTAVKSSTEALVITLKMENVDASKDYYALHWNAANQSYDAPIALKKVEGGLQLSATNFSPYTIVSKAKATVPEVIATVDGKDITTAHVYDGTLNLDAAGVAITDATMGTIIEKFLAWAEEDAKTSGETSYQIIFFYGEDEIRNDDLKMPVSEAAMASIEKLKTSGATFMINMGTEIGGAAFYRDITGATTLGFTTHDYLENSHWDFYGSGFDFCHMDFPYDKPGAVQFLYQSGNGTMGKKDITAQYDTTWNMINITTSEGIHISYPGLHFLVPKDTSTVENTISITGAASQAELKSVLTSSASTLEGSVKATLDTTENQIIDASLFSQMAERKDKVTALVVEHDNITYEIATADMNKTTVSMTVGAAENTASVQQKLGDTVKYAIDFAHSGDLPGATKVTIPVNGVADGNYFWSYLNESGQLVESQEVTVSGGKVQATITHCSTYVLTKEKPATSSGTGTGSGTSSGSGSSSSASSSSGSSNTSSAATLTAVPATSDVLAERAWLSGLLGLLAVCGLFIVKRRVQK